MTQWTKGDKRFEEPLTEGSVLREKLAELEARNRSLEQQLAEISGSLDLYRIIMRDTDDLIAITTFKLNPTYTFISPSHKKIMGYDPEDLVGKHGFDFVHPGDRTKLFPLLKKYVSARVKALFTGKQQEFSERIEYRARDKSGKWHYLQSTVNLLKGRDELLLISRDITEQKKVEAERRELETRLLQTEKMEAIGTLAGGVAHDLNNILSAIVNYPELILMDLTPDSPLRQQVLSIQQAGQRAAAIVTDLLTLARRSPLVEEVLNLNDVITEFLDSPECEKIKSYHPRVHIQAQLDPELLNLSGSPIHLRKVLMNLVSNGVEAITEEGAVTVSTCNRYVDKTIEGFDSTIPKGEYVALTVTDNGVGMSSEDLQKIFLPFYTKKTLGRSGTGLGMTVVWGSVKDHKGFIRVDSREGEGTTFELFLPSTRKKITRDEKDVSFENYLGNGETVVVIDDVEEQRKIASLLLTQLGYHVYTADSAEQAFELLQDRTPDLFILDMIMDPGPDGLDTYKLILKLFPNAKALIASGFSETDRVKEAQRLGAGEYIRKPYSLDTLAKAVKKEIKRKTL